ncbi:MAG: 16S rRNA (guanine(966)-N(2))-methyltransferase RsmD [Phascolarctobacterium sp.]|nr:16S rRNA (guanine(966)-N(2))-methyltransferase RsmD [Phascolarctobacterium sp.]
MRIITGRARGTNLFTPKNYDVRPTADRVKESVFNILGSSIVDARVLDAFAGTGNLGLECWSRGAAYVVFVDKSKVSLNLVQRNIEKCHAEDDCRCLEGDAVKQIARLERQGGIFDFIFLDPPYHQDLVAKFLQELTKYSITAPNCLIVAERAADEEPLLVPESFTIKREEKYGSTLIDFICKR